MIINDLIILGRAVPDRIKNGRLTVCTAGYSPSHGFIRLYPTRLDSPFVRWSIVSVPVERDNRDHRLESWKIEGSKSEWARLSRKIKVVGKFPPTKRLNLIGNLTDDCVQLIRGEGRSLGIVKPTIEKTYFAEREDYDEGIQRDYARKARKTADTFPKLTLVCERALASMWVMEKELETIIRTKWGAKELPPHQQWVSIYFFKNMTYLRAAYLLACEGSCGASNDLQRTAYETILRGYLFIVDENEARLFYNLIEGTIEPKKKEALHKRKFYPFKFLLKKLYKPKSRKSHQKIFHELSRFSHPSIRGVFLDMQYSEKQIEDCLKMILSLIYGTVQMMAEGFFELLDDRIKDTIKDTLESIASFFLEVPLFEPDKEESSSKIRLREGNFLTVLRAM